MSLPATGWQDLAACNGDPDWTAPPLPSIAERRQRTSRQLRVCDGCPVLQQCREYAAGFTWSGVVVAGWAAPHGNAMRFGNIAGGNISRLSDLGVDAKTVRESRHSD